MKIYPAGNLVHCTCVLLKKIDLTIISRNNLRNFKRNSLFEWLTDLIHLPKMYVSSKRAPMGMISLKFIESFIAFSLQRKQTMLVLSKSLLGVFQLFQKLDFPWIEEIYLRKMQGYKSLLEKLQLFRYNFFNL